MKWIKKKPKTINKNDKPFKIGKTYKFEAINKRDTNSIKHNNKAVCIELFETYALFQFKNYRECFMYTEHDYVISEVQA